ncbi:unnamed protein product [Brassicogethes aeneus]|uniref:MADF domain-containing protein n=1 Tax=Brassicogethes aeneus TaxID=1431903 RepID=A0A9P0AP45_BRAAE|nr:unnamed protein product [Brassicogethes aeneus]
MDIALFIIMIQSFPHLWDLKNKDYKNAEMKEQSWLQMAWAMESNVSDCKKLWKSLRDRYSRESRMLPSGSGSGTYRWEFFQAMSFYNKCLVRRKRVTTTQRVPAEVAPSTSSKDTIEANPWSSLEHLMPTESMQEYEEEGNEEAESQAESQAELHDTPDLVSPTHHLGPCRQLLQPGRPPGQKPLSEDINARVQISRTYWI